jgi:hypothetical protein
MGHVKWINSYVNIKNVAKTGGKNNETKDCECSTFGGCVVNGGFCNGYGRAE